MKAYINGRFLAQRVTGVQRFASETLRALDELLESTPCVAALCLLAPSGTPDPHLRNIGFRAVGRLQGHAWEQLELPRFARDGQLVGFAATGPLTKRNQLVTMHDASVFAVPEAFSPAFRLTYRALMSALVRVSRQTVTVSEFSRRELSKHLGVPAHRFVVCGEGHEHATRSASDPSILARHGLSPEGYFLAVGSNSAHKNFSVIARAVAHSKAQTLPVVVAGGSASHVFGGSQRADGLLRVGYVSDPELKALYEGAAAFVFPSLYEGFGLPPVEALALGCPVISSSAASMPEVLGDAALYFEPNDALGLAREMTLLSESAETRKALKQKAQAVLSRHRWENTARAYLRAIQVP